VPSRPPQWGEGAPQWGTILPHCDITLPNCGTILPHCGRVALVWRHTVARFCHTVARFCHTVARFCHTVAQKARKTDSPRPVPRLFPLLLEEKGGGQSPYGTQTRSTPGARGRSKEGKVRAKLAAWPPPLQSLAMPHLIESLTRACCLPEGASCRQTRTTLAEACTRGFCIDFELDSSLFSSRPPGDIPRPPSSRFGPSRPRPGLDLV
jgi:hypothetical protein